MYNKIPGTKDILPQESGVWQKAEEISRRTFSLYGYQEIRPPLLEDSALFNRSLGEATEIVQKQMFLIKNKEDSYVLRPEGTASIVRSYIENNLDKTTRFAKLYYIGPMFRLERPQKGRLRQFHHIGCEAIGSTDAHLDIETISLAENLLLELGISGFTLKLNSLGCSEDKKNLSSWLRDKLKNKLCNLCDECKVRFDRNVLRILDCKVDSCKEIVKSIGLGNDHLCADCRNHFNTVKSGLDKLGINYEASPNLVRGLDYYTRTVFEFTHDGLGAQDALGAGGRYDKLVAELGGPDVGSIGFALGVERLLIVSSIKVQEDALCKVYLITLGEAAKKEGVTILAELRKHNISCDTDYEGKSLKGSMRAANDRKAKFCAILGDDELKNGVITLKDMVSGEQRQIKLTELVEELKC